MLNIYVLLVSLLGIFIINQASAASPANGQIKQYQVSLTSTLGLDSNPYRFSNQFKTQSEKTQFLEHRLTAKYLFSPYWRTQVSLTDTHYQQSQNWGNQKKWSASLFFKKLKKRKKKYLSRNQRLFNLKYEQLDKTYVSRLSGGLSSYAGTQLNKRYNYQQLSTQYEQHINLSKKSQWQYELAYKNKDYENYANAGISDLDYQALNIENRFQRFISKRQHQQWRLNLAHRQYANKLQKDIKGDDIKDTNLTYLDATLGYEHSWQSSRKHTASVSTEYMKRDDNGSGYYNSHESSISFHSKYRFTGKSSFSSQYQYTDFAYERPSTQLSDTTTEEYGSHQKHRVKLKGRININRYLPLNAMLLLDYQYEQVSADKSQYQYSRHILETGLKFKF